MHAVDALGGAEAFLRKGQVDRQRHDDHVVAQFRRLAVEADVLQRADRGVDRRKDAVNAHLAVENVRRHGLQTRIGARKYGGRLPHFAAIADKRHGLAAESYLVIHNSIVFIIRWFNAIPMPPGCEPDLRNGTPHRAPPHPVIGRL